MKLGIKIGGSFGVMILIILAMGTFALVSGLNICSKAGSIANKHIPESAAEAKLNRIMANFQRSLSNYALSVKNDDYEKASTYLEEFKDALSEAEKASADPDYLQEIAKIEKSAKGLGGKLQAMKLGGKNKTAAENLFMQTNSVILTISNFCEQSLKHSKKAADETLDTAIAVAIVVLSAMAVALVVGFILAIGITRNIVKPMGKAVEVAEAVAAGDMSKRLDLNRNDEIGTLAKSLDNLPEAINRVLAEFNNTVEKIMHGHLNSRCDKTGFAGGYAELLENGNNLADAMGNFIETSSVPVLIIDKEFNVCYANKAATDVAEVAYEKFVGSKCYESMKSGDCQTSNCAVSKAMAAGQTCSQETTASPGGKNLEILYNRRADQKQARRNCRGRGIRYRPYGNQTAALSGCGHRRYAGGFLRGTVHGFPATS